MNSCTITYDDTQLVHSMAKHTYIIVTFILNLTFSSSDFHFIRNPLWSIERPSGSMHGHVFSVLVLLLPCPFLRNFWAHDGMATLGNVSWQLFPDPLLHQLRLQYLHLRIFFLTVSGECTAHHSEMFCHCLDGSSISAGFLGGCHRDRLII